MIKKETLIEMRSILFCFNNSKFRRVKGYVFLT